MSSQRSTSTSWFEFFLYASVILETALAAFVYKVIFRGPDLTSLTISLTVIYFGFLAWAIFQLNYLHRRRKLETSVPEPTSLRPLEPAPPMRPAPLMEVEPAPPMQPAPPMEPAPQMEVVETVPAARILGLTAAQVFVVCVVFAAALVSFTWALSILNAHR